MRDGFGSVLNRFCCQTVFGALQLHIEYVSREEDFSLIDSMQRLELSMEQLLEVGSCKIFNKIVEIQHA